MSIQLDLTTTTPCQNFDSAQGRMTLQNHRIIDVDNEIAQIFGYRTREELLLNVEFVYALVPDSYQELAKKRYLEAIKGKLKKGNCTPIFQPMAATSLSFAYHTLLNSIVNPPSKSLSSTSHP